MTYHRPSWPHPSDAAALGKLFHAIDLLDEAEEEEIAEVPCPTCDGDGLVITFGGHGYARIPHECHHCEGRGTVHPGDA
jgi:hypothetical protein